MSQATDHLTAPWRRLIAEFLDHLTELGRSSEMTRQHRHRLSLFAEHVGGDPSAVTRPHVLGWLAAGETSPLERKKRAQSVRIFFGWAHEQGYVSGNPTSRLVVGAASGPHRGDLPGPWSDAFGGWAKFMRTAGRPETTIDLRRIQISRVARELGVESPWDVTHDDLVEWLSAKRWRSQTRRSHRTTLRMFYGWARTFEHLAADPTSNLPAVETTPGVPRPAPDHRIKFALAGADARVRLMILLGATMGLRRAEIAKLHTDDITEKGLMVRGKGGKVRLVPMDPTVSAALASVPKGYVFPRPTTDMPLSAHYVGKLMTGQLGEGVTPHMLRHRFATVAYSAERDLRAVQTLLGHSRPETTAVYAQVAEASLATAVAAAAL